MKILSIKFKKHIMPNGSCGTGYSEPDIFEIETDIVTKLVYIDIWYRTKDEYYSIFSEAIKNAFERCYSHFADQIDVKCRNMDEAFDMYIKELKHK